MILYNKTMIKETMIKEIMIKETCHKTLIVHFCLNSKKQSKQLSTP